MEHSAFLDFLKEKRFNFTLQNRVDETKANRRSCRLSAALKMRNIGAMTPIYSPIKSTAKKTAKNKTPAKNANQSKVGPSPKKQLKFDDDNQKKEDGGVNRRLKKFKEWQIEKKKRLQEQKGKAKPLFKVHHIETASSFNLDPIYSKIKGKPVDIFLKKNNKQFVPIGHHKFKAPSNVKPILLAGQNDVKKPTTTSKIPHKMTLRSKNVASSSAASVVPTLKKNGEPKAKLMKGKTQKSPPKKTSSKSNGMVTIQGKTLHVIAENIIISDGKIIEPQKKLMPPVNSVKGAQRAASKTNKANKIANGVSESIPTNNSDNHAKEKPTRIHRKSTRNNEVADVQLNNQEKPSRGNRGSTRNIVTKSPMEVEIESNYQEPILVLSSEKKKKGNIQIHVISDSEEEKEKSPVKENKRRRWSMKPEVKTPLKMTQKRRLIPSEEVVSSSCDELLIENDRKVKRKRKKMASPLMEGNNNSSLSTAYSIELNSSLSEGPVTPNNKVEELAYVSPFVTMSRGKENARKEYHRRSTLGGDSDSKSTTPKAAAQYFTRVLEEQNNHLLSLCAKWNAYKLENSAEEVHDMINVAIGQTELLLKKKFAQFRGLIEMCETGNSEKPIKSMDLHGYYDTMHIQIVNLEKRFEYLDNLKSKDWEEILNTNNEEEIAAPPKKTTKAKAKVKKGVKTAASSGLRAMMEAKRKQLALSSIPTITVETPKNKRISNVQRSIRESSTKKRISSPGLTMMKVTQAAKSTYLTPNSSINTQPKSILKSEGKKKLDKNMRKSKMVLFQDDPSSPPA